jgi:glycosyltransferase AglD
MSKPYLSLVLALYNEGPTLEQSFKAIYKSLSKVKKSWEVILVEDKSTDDTLKKVQRILPNLKNTKLIVHKRNQGRGKTVSDGLRAAKGIYCGFLDVDLEVSSDYIPLFIKELEKGYEMVVGNRLYEKNLSALTRVVSSKGYKYIAHFLLNLPVDDTEAGYKFFRTKSILPVVSKTTSKGWFWDTEICARAYLDGLKISQIPVLFIRRLDKKSTVRLIPDSWDYLLSIREFKRSIS